MGRYHLAASNHSNGPRAMTRVLATASMFLCVGAAAMAADSQPAGPPDAGGVRIASFSPAITRILFDMGLGGQVVGVTQFCRLPAGVVRPRIGNALNISSDAILAARPDVILSQTDPEKFRGVLAEKPDVQVVTLELERLSDIPAAIERIGDIAGRPDLAAACRAAFDAKILLVRKRVAGLARPRVLFVMGTDRPTAAGSDNFVHDLIELAGGVNVGAEIPGATRWRRTHIDAIAKAAPDVLICQSLAQGAAAGARAYWLQWRDLPASAGGRIHVVTDPEWSIPSTHLVIISHGDPLGRIMKTYEKMGRPAQISLMVGDHIGNIERLVDWYLPKPAIDRTTFRMADLLKARLGTNEPAPERKPEEKDAGEGCDP